MPPVPVRMCMAVCGFLVAPCCHGVPRSHTRHLHRAPKRRFVKFDVSTGQMAGGGLDAGTLATLVGGLIGVGVLAYVGLTVGNL